MRFIRQEEIRRQKSVHTVKKKRGPIHTSANDWQDGEEDNSGENNVNGGTPPQEINILPLGWKDISSIRQLEKEIYPQDRFPVIDLVGAYILPFNAYIKAQVKGEFAGMIIGERFFGIGKAWIVALRVARQFQHMGIGSALLSACEDHLGAAVIHLSVRGSLCRSFRLPPDWLAPHVGGRTPARCGFVGEGAHPLGEIPPPRTAGAVGPHGLQRLSDIQTMLDRGPPRNRQG